MPTSIWLSSPKMNHNAPLGPTVRPAPGALSRAVMTLSAVGTQKVLSWALGVLRPIGSLPVCANQRAPSGPTVMPPGKLFGLRGGNSRTSPVVVRPMWSLLPTSVNHSAPSGPVVIPVAELCAAGEAELSEVATGREATDHRC